ncbi:hypothetical protein H7Y40_00935 [Pedobacter sp.]|nr:hypothetical protein [Candidatus Saccharibacteria bacterium]
MKYAAGLLVSMVLGSCFFGNVSALSTVPTEPFLTSSPLLITSYSTNLDQTVLDFVQLYNTSDSLLVLDGWQVGYTTTLDATKVTFVSLDGMMLPKSHYVLAVSGGLFGAGVRSYPSMTLAAPAKLKSVVLLPLAGILPSDQPVVGSGVYRRNLTTTGYSTSTTFTKQDAAALTSIAADPLYIAPGAPQLKIVEIVARSADCAPNDTSLVCGDYVKLQNTSDLVYDMSNYRLRSDSGTSESSNAFSLGWLIEPAAYFTVHLKDDGDTLSLTDSGGYVWLEDVMGIISFYDQTMVGYPSASSASKQGWAWALGDDGVWQWTSTPQPDAKNVITVPVEVAPTVIAVDSDCPAGKYRNPDTNRCKNIEEAIATLVACDEGQYRSSETNRCRSTIVAASATLTPCDVGEERNPATNRCRVLVNGSSTVLAPCPAGQERNPDTNRCRKIVSSLAATTLTEPGANNNGLSPYWIGGAAAILAAGYGIYEWRSELMKLFRKIVPTSQ